MTTIKDDLDFLNKMKEFHIQNVHTGYFSPFCQNKVDDNTDTQPYQYAQYVGEYCALLQVIEKIVVQQEHLDKKIEDCNRAFFQAIAELEKKLSNQICFDPLNALRSNLFDK